MKKKNWMLPGLLAFLVVAGSLAVGFSSRASVQKQKATPPCCLQSKKCTLQPSSPVEMIPDNFTRQFMSILSPAH
jgi:hypothetical protein